MTEAPAGRPDGSRILLLAAIAAAGMVTAVGTGATLLTALRAAPVASAAPAVPLPLDGYWQTYANGDRIGRVALDGDRVWTATEAGGVVRWDARTGAHRQYLAPQDGLRSNVVHDVEVAPDGTVWAATQAGLSRYDPGADRWATLLPTDSPGMPARAVTALAATPAGQLWVGFAQEWDRTYVEPISKRMGGFRPGGLALFDPATGRWEPAYHVQFVGDWDDPRFKDIPSENVAVLELATDGTLWIGTVPYMVFDPSTCTDSDCPDEVGYWMPAGGGLAAYDGNAWANWHPTTDRAGSCYPTIVRDMAPDKNGWMWVAGGGHLLLMREGLTRIGCAGQVRYAKARLRSVGMRGNVAWSVDVDDQGRVWVGQSETFEKGVGLGVLDYNGTLDDFDDWDSDDYWEFVDLDGVPGTSDLVAGALRVAADGRVVVGTRDHRNGDGDGVRIYDPRGGGWVHLRTAADGLPSNQIVDVDRSPATGDLWVTTAGRGVARFDGEHWRTWRMFQPGDRVAGTTVDVRKGAGSIPTDIPDRETFDRLFPPESSYVRFGGDPTRYRILGYTVASKSIRVHPGLVADAPAGTPVFAVDRGPASDTGSQVAIGGDGTVWAGGRETTWLGNCGDYPYCWLDGGLGRWDGERWTVYDLSPTLTGLSVRDAEVSAVELDTRGRVWVGTGDPFQGHDGKGIFVFDPAAGTWMLYDVVSIKARDFAGDAIADMDLDPVSGDMWVAHHAYEVCSNSSPFGGGCTPSYTGGGVSRWDGTAWRKWSKRAGAALKVGGDEGEMRSIAVDRWRDRVWVGGYDTGQGFHWLQGIGIDAVLNWCPLDCTNDAWQHVSWEDDGIVSAIEVDDTGVVWVGTHRHGNGLIPPVGGIKLFDGNEWSTWTTESSGVPSNEITALHADGDTMWIGTLSHGLGHYYAVPPSTATPEPTATPDPTATRTRTPPRATPSVTTATTSPTRPAPTVETPRPVECGPGEPCPILLPLVLQRRACGDACPTTVPRTATSTSTPTVTARASATATRTPPETVLPTATATPTDTRAPAASPTRTTRPSSTPTPTATETPPPPRAWSPHPGQVARETYHSVDGSDADHVWIVGTNSKVLYWDGARLTTQKASLADGLTLRRVRMYSASRGYAMGDESALYETRDGGQLWRRAYVENYADSWRAMDIAPVPGGGYLGWLLGNLNGNRLRWTGSGTWGPQSPNDRNNRSHAYSDVAVVGPTLAYAVSDASTGARIYRWDGTSWTPGPSTVALYDLDVPSATQGVAVGRGGAVWRMGADGTWSKADGPRTGGQDLYAAAMLADDDIWVAGARGKLYRWNGSAWNDHSIAAMVKNIRAMWMTAAGDDGWAVGEDGLVLRYR